MTFFGGGGGGDNGDDGDGLEDYGDRAAFPGWVVRESESQRVVCKQHFASVQNSLRTETTSAGIVSEFRYKCN